MLAVIIIYTLIALGYLVLCFVVVRVAMKKAQAKGLPKWKYGIPAALFMYMTVFWDYIPTEVAYLYYCNKDAGFFVYKSLDEWVAENPGIAEKQDYTGKIQLSREGHRGRISRYYMSERFDFTSEYEPIFAGVVRNNQKFIDKFDQSILSEYIDYQSGGVILKGIIEIPKPWQVNGRCFGNKPNIGREFNSFRDNFRILGKVNKWER
ncbi:MAG: hypothetical protein JKY88_07385 [Pseudomonadales bacterium]|nr:hypothetical protein [Pseudomonadales bacterium]